MSHAQWRRHGPMPDLRRGVQDFCPATGPYAERASGRTGARADRVLRIGLRGVEPVRDDGAAVAGHPHVLPLPRRQRGTRTGGARGGSITRLSEDAPRGREIARRAPEREMSGATGSPWLEHGCWPQRMTICLGRKNPSDTSIPVTTRVRPMSSRNAMCTRAWDKLVAFRRKAVEFSRV